MLCTGSDDLPIDGLVKLDDSFSCSGRLPNGTKKGYEPAFRLGAT